MADFVTNKVNGQQCDASDWNQLADIDNTIISSDQAPSTGDLNQIGKAMANYTATADFYTDSGSANVYTLTAISPFQTPSKYTNGMKIRFRPANNGTGAATVAVGALGAKSIKKADGVTDVASGDIVTTADLELRYDGTNFRLTGSSATSSVITSYFESSQQVITLGGGLTIAHGLGAKPTLYKAFLQCTTAEYNYSIGDETPMLDSDLNTAGGGSTVALIPDATNIVARYGSAAIYVLNKTTGAYNAITTANWRLVIRAWA